MNRPMLYTWLDVEFVLEQLRAEHNFPEWLVSTSVYTDGLVLRVAEGTEQASVDEFLRGAFGTRWEPNLGLILAGRTVSPRVLTIDVEHVPSTIVERKPESLTPTFRRVVAISETLSPAALPAPLPASPKIFAFYSFKGGVGRTTHLLSYLSAMSARPQPMRALVIDADLEAPGITSLLRHEVSVRPPEFSFVDLIALAQGDNSHGFEDTLSIAASAIRTQVVSVEGTNGYVDHFVLPAFRSEEQAMRIDIRPEHLITRPSRAWALTELLADLGRRLDIETVLVDLRAGYSELASPILFDPRVRRVLVTTPSQQSLDGTKDVLRQLAKLAPPPSRTELKDPIVIMSFLVAELMGSEALSDVSTALLEGYPESEADVDLPRLQIEYTTFAQELLYISSISDAFRKLSGTSIDRVMSKLVAADAPLRGPGIIAQRDTLSQCRIRLSQLASELEYAETGQGNQFLKIAPLRALARQFAEVLPVAVVLGSKGAGKTYTCLQIVRRKTWSTFVNDAGVSTGEEKGFIWPVLQSSNLRQAAVRLVDDCRMTSAAALNLNTRATSTAIEDAVREGLRTPADETWWRHKWFAIMARSLGIEAPMDNAAAGLLIERFKGAGATLVMLFDGLEDLFPALESHQDQQVALRALLQGVPRYLQEIPECPIGIVAFARADLAQAAIPQNYGQFARLYEPFSLKWNEEEALRLAVWLAQMAEVPLEPTLSKSPETMTASEAKDALVALWGRKLGPEDSREARSSEWVIAALSDFRGQIQARDLVRFLRYAADDRRNATVEDRVLAPRAVRDAIEPCSTRKISEITQEIPSLKGIFLRLQNSTARRIPFDTASSGLTAEEIRFLQTVGVLLEDRGEFFMPEIFRLGLGFQLAQGARPRVLSLARRVVSSPST